jgi:hypothetical protein
MLKRRTAAWRLFTENKNDEAGLFWDSFVRGGGGVGFGCSSSSP